MGKLFFILTSPQPFEGNEKTKPFFNVDRQKRGFFFIVETVVVWMRRSKSIFTSQSQSVFALRGLDRIPLSFYFFFQLFFTPKTMTVTMCWTRMRG
jgi:hypothetical protein